MAKKKPPQPRRRTAKTEKKGDSAASPLCKEFPGIWLETGKQMDEDKRAEAVVAVAHACESLAKALEPAKPFVSIQNCVIHQHGNHPGISIA